MAGERNEQLIFRGPGSQWANAGRFLWCGGFIALGWCVPAILRAAGQVDVDVLSWARLGGMALAGFAFLIALRGWWRIRFTVYRVTNDRVEIERGLVAKRIENLELFRVSDLSLGITVAERILGIGNIVLLTGDETTPKLTLRGIRRPRAVYDQLKREAVLTARRRGVMRIEQG